MKRSVGLAALALFVASCSNLPPESGKSAADPYSRQVVKSIGGFLALVEDAAPRAATGPLSRRFPRERCGLSSLS